MDLVVQHPPASPGRRMGPTPGLGTHAHSTADGPQARAQHLGAGAGRPTAETRNPPHHDVRRHGGMGKQDSPPQGAKPQEHGGAVPREGTRSAPASQV